MAKRMTATEQVTVYATIGESLVALVRESGLLRPKRRTVRRKRTVRRAARPPKATEPVAKRRGKMLAEVDT